MIKGDKSRDDLIKALNKHLSNIIYNRKVRETIKDNLVNVGFDRGRASGLLTTTITPLNDASLVELYYISAQAYEHGKVDELNPKDYFEESEIEFAKKNPPVKEEEQLERVIVLDNVKQVNDWQFTSIATLQQLNDWFNRRLITYNVATQRETNKEFFNNQMYETPNFNYDKIESIKETIQKKAPITNIITLNIRETGSEKFSYDPKTEKLIIPVDNDATYVDIIDAAHRAMGIIKLLEEQPDHTYNFIVNVYHYDEKTARRFIYTQDLQTPISQLHIQTMKPDEPYMAMAREINQFDEDNYLYKKIGTEMNEVEEGEAYTTYEILSKAIELNFDESKKLQGFERTKIKKFLINGFVYIIGTFEDKFKNKVNSQLTSVITNPYIFYGYVAMLSQLYKQPNWEDKLEKTLAEIDWSKNNPVWNEIGLTKKINVKSIKKICEKFREFVQ